MRTGTPVRSPRFGYAALNAPGADARVVTALIGIALALATVVAFHEAFAALAERWRERPADSHGFLVAALVPILLWRGRNATRDRTDGAPRVQAVGRALALACLVAAAAGAVLARAASIDVLAWVLLPAIAACACAAAIGPGVLRRFALPLGFFLFAVPVWEVLTPALQALTVKATTALISVAGIHAFIDGNFVHVRAGSFEIAGGCAGTSYLVAALALAVLAGHVENLALRSRALLVAAFAAAALGANWVRVALVIAAGDATDMQSPLVRDHLALGWGVFAVAVTPLFAFVLRAPVRGAGAAGPRAPGESSVPEPVSRPAPAWTFAAAMAVLGGGAWSDVIRTFEPPAVPTLTAPLVAGWNSQTPGTRAWRPAVPGALAECRRTYVRHGREVDAYAAFLGAPAAGREVVGESVRVGGDADAYAGGWKSTPVGRVREYVVPVDGVDERLVWLWYEVRGRRLDSPWSVKWFESLRAFALPARSGLVAVSTACDGDCAAARRTLAAALVDGLDRLRAGTAANAQRMNGGTSDC